MSSLFKNLQTGFLVVVVLCGSLSAQSVYATEEDDGDPWRGINEKMHNFNEFFDRNLLKPVAKGYKKITPEPVRKGVGNFFSNLGEPIVFINDLFQLKPIEAGVDLARFAINTTIGFAGIFDVATRMELHKNDEDFGQTLGRWGVPAGPYVVIPFLGPSNVRDGLSKIPSTFLSPSTNLSDEPVVNGSLFLLNMVNMRAGLLDLEKMIIGDRYVGMRDIMVQLREHQVNDGNVEDDFVDEEDSWLDE